MNILTQTTRRDFLKAMGLGAAAITIPGENYHKRYRLLKSNLIF